MNPVRLIFLKNFIEAVASCFSPDENDYSHNQVIFPGSRPVHYLRETLGNKLGKSFLPPEGNSIDGFINQYYESRLNITDRLLGTFDAVALLHEIHVHASYRMGGARFIDPDSFFPLGLKLFSDLDELSSNLVPVKLSGNWIWLLSKRSRNPRNPLQTLLILSGVLWQSG